MTTTNVNTNEAVFGYPVKPGSLVEILYGAPFSGQLSFVVGNDLNDLAFYFNPRTYRASTLWPTQLVINSRVNGKWCNEERPEYICPHQDDIIHLVFFIDEKYNIIINAHIEGDPKGERGVFNYTFANRGVLSSYKVYCDLQQINGMAIKINP